MHSNIAGRKIRENYKRITEDGSHVRRSVWDFGGTRGMQMRIENPATLPLSATHVDENGNLFLLGYSSLGGSSVLG